MKSKARKTNILIILLIIVVGIPVFYPKPWVVGGLSGGPLVSRQTAYREEFSCIGVKLTIPLINCMDCGAAYPCFGLVTNKQCTIEQYSEAGIRRTPVACRDNSIQDGSNLATALLTVPPNLAVMSSPTSFETGTEGWAPAYWEKNAGRVEQSADYASEGSYSLKIITADGGWFGVLYDSPINLTGKTHISFEIKMPAIGASQSTGIQVGGDWGFCTGEGTGGWINPGTTTTVNIDLLNLGCISSPNLSQVYSLYIWFRGSGIFYLDNVRAE